MTQEGMVTTRGLIDAEIGPLRRFTGILDSVPTEMQTYKKNPEDDEEAGKKTKRVTINSASIDVKEAVEPYHFPTHTFIVSESNRRKSRWGVLSEGTPKDHTVGFNNVADQQYSAEQLDPGNANFIKPADRMSIKDCIGKRIGWVMTDGLDGRPEPMDLFDGRAGIDKPTPAWTVYEIEGVGVAGSQGVNTLDLALGILYDKTLAEFNTAALANPVIRNDTALLQSISKPPTAPDSFANTMLTAGRVTQDESGIFHKVA